MAGALVLVSGCGGHTSGRAVTAPTAKTVQACMVTDTNGLNDNSFNAAAWQGMNEAKAKNGAISISYLESTNENDYQTNLNHFLGKKCTLILTVGGMMGAVTKATAQGNPQRKFAIVDDSVPLPNVYSMQFDAAQAAFLAGYLAAGMTKTGTVATYGGSDVPTTTVFMDGFVDGVAHYNQVKGKQVQVLGWDKDTQSGSFVGSFTAQDAGQKLSDGFVAQGADVIMPVAELAGLGTADAAVQSHGRYSVIWTNQDGCVSAEDDCPAFLTTVVKNISGAVRDAVLKAAQGTLSGGTTAIGTLANNGVGLAPYHDFDGKVPAELKKEIDKLRQDIISGAVRVSSPSQPGQLDAAQSAAPTPS